MDDIAFKIAIPTDNGFWGRECNICSKYFKIEYDKAKDKMYCPYCGELQSNSELITKEQKNVIDKIARPIAKRLVEDELQKLLGNAFRGNKFVTFTSSKERSQIPKQDSHVEKEVDTELVCPKCEMKFQVYGIFGFCPSCGEDNILIYEANLALILQEIETSNDKTRALRHAYNDLVTTFESYCKKVSSKNNQDFANFQNLKNAKEHFKKYDLDIYLGVSDEEKTKLKRVFEKRHAFQHANGKITEEFIRNIPEDKKLLNSIAILSKEEFIVAISILKIILKNITNKFIN